MFEAPIAETIPLIRDDSGTIRVAGTRVTLETVIAAFRRGATAETIVDKYDVLSLTDVYLVIGYYLQHRDEVDAYIQQQKEIGDQVRRENETRFDPHGIRERLLARR